MGNPKLLVILYVVIDLTFQEEADGGDQTRVAVIEKATGKILSGEDAPLSSELTEWLERNPG